jgi:hypothetical protein
LPSQHHHSLRQKTALGAAVLALAGGAWLWAPRHDAVTATRTAIAPPLASALADVGAAQPTADALLVANWVTATHDNGALPFLLVDKKASRVYVFASDGRLQDSAPALLGAARGDEIVPGSAQKTPAEMKAHEKTTPAGRYVAEAGVNADDEDVVWVDYDAAISMHRVRPSAPREHRLERLASATAADNRISFGCINLPVKFYEDVLRPAVADRGAIVYVLPEVKTVQQVFGAYDVTDPLQVAAARHPAARPAAG